MNTTNFQPLTEQQCKETNGGYNVITNILGIPVNLDLTNLNTIGSSLGNTLVGVSGAVTGVLMNVSTLVANLLSGLGNVGNLGR
ncbi:MAG: hypothetical protein J7578_06360 [Chitinophagaceae bacterium]|nr:hypothetical protein [Chitinophagaceae bacterium]